MRRLDGRHRTIQFMNGRNSELLVLKRSWPLSLSTLRSRQEGKPRLADRATMRGATGKL